MKDISFIIQKKDLNYDERVVWKQTNEMQFHEMRMKSLLNVDTPELQVYLKHRSNT